LDWTKIKPKHFISNNLSYANKGRLVTLICYTAVLNRIPNEGEMNSFCGRNGVQSLTKCLPNGHQMISDILQKVVDDCKKVEHKKEVSRETSRRYEEKKRLEQEKREQSDVSSDTIEKIREDKRREDNKNLSKEKQKWLEGHFNRLYELYPRKLKKQKAWGAFKKSIKTEKDIKDCETALENYIEYANTREPDFIKHASTWFNEWQEWVENPIQDLQRNATLKKKTKTTDAIIERMIKNGSVA